MSVIEITTPEEFKEQVLGSASPVVVDFNADWCGPCQMMRPMLEKLAGADSAKIFSVNIDNLPELAEKYQVAGIPCLVKIQNGEELDRSVGLLPEKKLQKFITE